MEQATEEEQQWIMLSENLQRKDLSEVEKAEQIHEILSAGQTLTRRALAKKLGINHQYIYDLLNLHGYPTEVKEMVKKEEISAKTIRPLAQLDTPIEQIKVANYIKDNRLNYDETKDIVDKVKLLPPTKREEFKTNPDITIDKVVIPEIMDDKEEDSKLITNDWNTFLVVGKQLYDILEKKNIKQNFNAFDRLQMKQYLISLKERINELLSEIDG